MDQAASVISNAHSALYITFHPRLSAEPIPLPVTTHKAVFVCANSLVVADKVVSSKSRYNLRVLETLVAARVLARHLNIPVLKTEKLTLKQVLGRFCGFSDSDEIAPAELSKGLERIILEVDSLKKGDPDNGFTLEEMVEASGLTSEGFHELFLSWIEGEPSFPSICFHYVPFSKRLKQSKRSAFNYINAHFTFSLKPCAFSSSENYA